MGRRARRRERSGAAGTARPQAPVAEYRDAEGNTLRLRGSLTAAARREYADTLAANPLSREDAWQRAGELLFERLAVRWTIAGAPLQRQGELLARFRAATPAERAWVREALRQHCAEHFPELPAP